MVSGRRVRAYRVATVLRDLEERRAVAGATVTRSETRVPSPRRDQKVRTTAHASHYCESCASRCTLLEHTARVKKSRSHHD